MARKLRLDCFLLCALQQNGGFFHACYTVGHMQDTLICLVHVSCHKPCSRSAEYYHLLISSFPRFFFGKNFSFFFPTALTSWRFCICFNWLRQLLQSLELYSASNLGLVAKALSRCYQQFQARCGQVSMNLSILKIHKRLPCFV